MPEDHLAILKWDAAPLVPPPQNIPSDYADRMAGLVRHNLTALFAIKGFGVAHTRLPPGGISGLRHSHSARDEFIYVLEGQGVLVRGDEEYPICAGAAAGFAPGVIHQLINRSDNDFVYLDITSAADGDKVTLADCELSFFDQGANGGRGFGP